MTYLEIFTDQLVFKGMFDIKNILVFQRHVWYKKLIFQNAQGGKFYWSKSTTNVNIINDLCFELTCMHWTNKTM